MSSHGYHRGSYFVPSSKQGLSHALLTPADNSLPTRVFSWPRTTSSAVATADTSAGYEAGEPDFQGAGSTPGEPHSGTGKLAPAGAPPNAPAPGDAPPDAGGQVPAERSKSMGAVASATEVQSKGGENPSVGGGQGPYPKLSCVQTDDDDWRTISFRTAPEEDLASLEYKSPEELEVRARVAGGLGDGGRSGEESGSVSGEEGGVPRDTRPGGAVDGALEMGTMEALSTEGGRESLEGGVVEENGGEGEGEGAGSHHRRHNTVLTDVPSSLVKPPDARARYPDLLVAAGQAHESGRESASAPTPGEPLPQPPAATKGQAEHAPSGGASATWEPQEPLPQRLGQSGGQPVFRVAEVPGAAPDARAEEPGRQPLAGRPPSGRPDPAPEASRAVPHINAERVHKSAASKAVLCEIVELPDDPPTDASYTLYHRESVPGAWVAEEMGPRRSLPGLLFEAAANLAWRWMLFWAVVSVLPLAFALALAQELQAAGLGRWAAAQRPSKAFNPGRDAEEGDLLISSGAEEEDAAPRGGFQV